MPSTASVFVLIMAIEFRDGSVAYIGGRVGCIANADAGKLYSATTAPKAAWASFGMNEALSPQIRAKKSRFGQKEMAENGRVGFFIKLRQVSTRGFGSDT